MTATIVPVSQYDEATLTRATAGERMRMDTGAAPLKDLLQAFADRDKFALDALIATIGWGGDFSVDPGGSNSSFSVNIGAIGAVVLAGASSGYKVFSAAATTIGASKISGGSPLANDVWYYVYAYDNAGTLDYEISTTALNSSRRTKSGDPTRRYLGCFRTTSAGAPIPVRASRGKYVYRRSGLASGDFVAKSGTDTSWTPVDLSGFIPPHARLASVELVAASGGTLGSAKLRTAGDTAGGVYAVNVNATALDTSHCTFDIETDSSRTLEYQNTHASITTDVSACGFSE